MRYCGRNYRLREDNRRQSAVIFTDDTFFGLPMLPSGLQYQHVESENNYRFRWNNAGRGDRQDKTKLQPIPLRLPQKQLSR